MKAICLRCKQLEELCECGTVFVHLDSAKTTGWTCPKCGGCYAPSVVECQRCAPSIGHSPYQAPLDILYG